MSVMRRFWDEVSVREAGGGFEVLLDQRSLRIPGAARGGAALILPGRALADAIAAEWQAAGGEKGGALSFDAVPLTRLAGTAQDRIAPAPGPVVAELARYAETDLLCYRAERPEALVVRQARLWQPWLDWLQRTHGARLVPTEGIVFAAQDPAALARVAAVLQAQSAWTLAGLGIAIPSLGSAVLGLAMAAGALDAADAHGLATLDERFEIEQWGEDAEATVRLDRLGADVALAGRFMHLAAAP